mgnify:CR=1 FL=1
MTTIPTDLAIKSLQNKHCPLHDIPMDEIKPLTTPDLSYVRQRFRCPEPRCRCRIDFVDGEIKTEPIEDTLYWLSCLELSDDTGMLRS